MVICKWFMKRGHCFWTCSGSIWSRGITFCKYKGHICNESMRDTFHFGTNVRYPTLTSDCEEYASRGKCLKNDRNCFFQGLQNLFLVFHACWTWWNAMLLMHLVLIKKMNSLDELVFESLKKFSKEITIWVLNGTTVWILYKKCVKYFFNPAIYSGWENNVPWEEIIEGMVKSSGKESISIDLHLWIILSLFQKSCKVVSLCGTGAIDFEAAWSGTVSHLKSWALYKAVHFSHTFAMVYWSRLVASTTSTQDPSIASRHQLWILKINNYTTFFLGTLLVI